MAGLREVRNISRMFIFEGFFQAYASPTLYERVQSTTNGLGLSVEEEHSLVQSRELIYRDDIEEVRKLHFVDPNASIDEAIKLGKRKGFKFLHLLK